MEICSKYYFLPCRFYLCLILIAFVLNINILCPICNKVIRQRDANGHCLNVQRLFGTFEGNRVRTFCYFINHFNLDCALYIYYQEGRPNVLYNDSGCSMTAEVLLGIRRAIKEYPQGFAASKIGEGFLEHQDMITYFGEDDVCSFVAVPFMKNGTLTSLLITYVRMKDNWHGSIERYMLNEDDLYIYRLLFREMEYSINRLEAYEKASEMNKRLQAAAETDMLTGVYNRAGMYEQIAQIEEHLKDSPQGFDVGLMFIDLDNFKHYNDTFGHDIGDLILKEMAAIFKDVLFQKRILLEDTAEMSLLLFLRQMTAGNWKRSRRKSMPESMRQAVLRSRSRNILDMRSR